MKRKNSEVKDSTVRYYTKEEWFALSKTDRSKIIAKRKLLKSSNKKKKQSQAQKIAALEKKLEEQTQVIASLQTTDTDTVSGGTASQEAPLPPAPTGNPLQPPTGFTQ